jgi:hypothetical protein
MAKLARVMTVEPLEGYKLRVSFTDGTSRVVDFEEDLEGRLFGPLKDLGLFRQVRVEGGTLVWPNGADVCPDALYYQGTPPWAKERLKKAAP